MVTIVRGMLPEIGIRPGDMVECWTTDDGVFHMRAWKNRENAPYQHPVVVPPISPAVSR
jgi:hypothetical protein